MQILEPILLCARFKGLECKVPIDGNTDPWLQLCDRFRLSRERTRLVSEGKQLYSSDDILQAAIKQKVVAVFGTPDFTTESSSPISEIWPSTGLFSFFVLSVVAIFKIPRRYSTILFSSSAIAMIAWYHNNVRNCNIKLLNSIKECYIRAKRTRAISKFHHSPISVVDEKGNSFIVSQINSVVLNAYRKSRTIGVKKNTKKTTKSFDPFADPDPGLVIDPEFGPNCSHVLLLNKFPALYVVQFNF